MNQLQWLPIQALIDFKIATLTYKAVSSDQPAYLQELISRTNLRVNCDPVISLFQLSLALISLSVSALFPGHLFSFGIPSLSLLDTLLPSVHSNAG